MTRVHPTFDTSTLRSASIALAFGALCGVALAATAAAQSGPKVTIASFAFAPATVTAAPNAPITWTNNDNVPHQVVVASKSLKTAALRSGQSAQLTIADRGSYDYVCGIHASMRGKIEIK
jgi:plastocyanin